MENSIVDLLTQPTVLTAVFVGVGVLILVYILKLIRKDEVVVQKPKNERPSQSEKKEKVTSSGKTKKKVADNRRTARNEKQAYSHPWLLTTLKGHTGSILDMEFSSNGKYLTSCGDEDPDLGSLASGETSSSSSYCTQDNSRASSLESSPRVNKGLSRRQRKNRRPEKPKKTPTPTQEINPAPNTSTMAERRERRLEPFRKTRETFEMSLRYYVSSSEQLFKSGYPMESKHARGSVTIYKAPFPGFPAPRFDVNAREFVPKHESSDSGQGSSEASDSDECSQRSHKKYSKPLHKSSTWPQVAQAESERTCVRCRKPFHTTATKYITKEKCLYHWGRLRPVIVPGERHSLGQKKFTCCGGLKGSTGCEQGPVHVWNGVVDGTNGPYRDFCRTKPLKHRPKGAKYGVYALDCEMCYTVRGLECTKVTVVGETGRTVYESYVRPDLKIVDYNTRFSGITAQHLSGENAKSLRQVQTELLTIINDYTILIGHGLENDLRVLKILHTKIVDTTHVYPHLRGLPFKRSLKELMLSVLDSEIQGSSNGHDSYEDACACLELMLSRVKHDFRHEIA